MEARRLDPADTSIIVKLDKHCSIPRSPAVHQYRHTIYTMDYSLTSTTIPCPFPSSEPIDATIRCTRPRCQQRRASRTRTKSSSNSPTRRSKHERSRLKVRSLHQTYMPILTMSVQRPIIGMCWPSTRQCHCIPDISHSLGLDERDRVL